LVKASDRRLARLFRHPLTAPRQFDILQVDSGWQVLNAIRPIETARVHRAARWRGGRSPRAQQAAAAWPLAARAQLSVVGSG
jgi:hypothetical protein